MRHRTLLLQIATILICIGGIILTTEGRAQGIPTRETVPAYESRDWYVWYVAYHNAQAAYGSEHALRKELGESSEEAITGLQEELTDAKSTIASQNRQSVLLARKLDEVQGKLDAANVLLSDRPKTAFGRFWKELNRGVRIAVPSVIAGVLVGAMIPR